MQIIQSIQNRIYEIRGERVMLDKDLASLYEVPTKSLNLAVKRNMERFPADFMFQLTTAEYEALRFQIETLQKSDPNLRFQFETSSWGGTRYLPYVFTEHGIAMLSSVLRSKKAIEMNIAIMRAFVQIRQLALQPHLADEIRNITEKIAGHDMQISQIYEALENILDRDAAQRRWESRERIGYKI